jgi:hypothetical protein
MQEQWKCFNVYYFSLIYDIHLVRLLVWNTQWISTLLYTLLEHHHTKYLCTTSAMLYICSVHALANKNWYIGLLYFPRYFSYRTAIYLHLNICRGNDFVCNSSLLQISTEFQFLDAEFAEHLNFQYPFNYVSWYLHILPHTLNNTWSTKVGKTICVYAVHLYVLQPVSMNFKSIAEGWTDVNSPLWSYCHRNDKISK